MGLGRFKKGFLGPGQDFMENSCGIMGIRFSCQSVGPVGFPAVWTGDETQPASHAAHTLHPVIVTGRLIDLPVPVSPGMHLFIGLFIADGLGRTDIRADLAVPAEFIDPKIDGFIDFQGQIGGHKGGSEVGSPKKKWKMAGRPDKMGKKTQLEIGLFDCPKCHKPFRVVLNKKKI